jgi:diguanylate cyclase (GGDEF)-like protein
MRNRLRALSADALWALLFGVTLVVTVGMLVAPRMRPEALWTGLAICLAAQALVAALLGRIEQATASEPLQARLLELAAAVVSLSCAAYIGWLAGTGPSLGFERQAVLGMSVLAGCIGAIGTLAASPLMLGAIVLPLFGGAAGALSQVQDGSSLPWLLADSTCAAALLVTGSQAVRQHRAVLSAALRERVLVERQWAAFEAAPAGVALTQGKRLLRATTRLRAWFGFAPDNALPRSELSWVLGRSENRMERLLARAEARVHGRDVRELEVKVRGGGNGLLRLGVQVRRLDPQQPSEGLLWTITDRTAGQAMSLAVAQDELRDPLTGALSRRGLTTALIPLLTRDLDKRPLGVMCLDLNGFKPLNDRHGHVFGDRVLCTVHERVKRALRGTDLVARPTGDEFMIVLDPLDDACQAAAIAERLSEIIAAPMLLEGMACQVQASMGLAIAPGDGRDADMLIECADRAMGEVKRAISPGPPKPAARSGPDRRSPH